MSSSASTIPWAAAIDGAISVPDRVPGKVPTDSRTQVEMMIAVRLANRLTWLVSK